MFILYFLAKFGNPDAFLHDDRSKLGRCHVQTNTKLFNTMQTFNEKSDCHTAAVNSRDKRC